MLRSRTALSTKVLTLALALFATQLAAPAFASDASDAFKAAKEMQKATKAEKDDAKKKELEDAQTAFVKGKIESLKASPLKRMDLTYLAQLQAMAGELADAVVTARKAVDSKEESQYGPEIYAILINILIEKGDLTTAGEDAKKFATLHEGHKMCKTVLVNVGMAYRKALTFDKSAEFLAMALEASEWSITKALVNDYVMLGQKDKAIAVINTVIEKGPAVIKEDMQTLLAITQKIGEKFDLPKFDAFVPAGEPEMAGKIVVIGVWNVSSKSMAYTLKLLDRVKEGFGEEVVCLAATTYYKKNAETGKMDESITPEQERGWGGQLKDQMNYGGRMAWFPAEADLRTIGMSALPHLCVIGKDGRLLMAHTMNTLDNTDVEVLKKVLAEAQK